MHPPFDVLICTPSIGHHLDVILLSTCMHIKMSLMPEQEIRNTHKPIGSKIVLINASRYSNTESIMS
jgi:hypothetical protein